MANKLETKYATHATASELTFRGDKNSQVVVKNIDSTSDKAGSVIGIFEKTTGPYTLDGAAASGQAVVPLAATSGLTNGDKVVIRSKTDMTKFEKGVISSISAGVSITLAGNLTYTYASGDEAFEMMTTIASIANGAASKNRGNGQPVAAAAENSPLYAVLDSTSAGDLSMTAEYVPVEGE
ncbi:MAG: hypothetical protein WC529_08900 [Candidatus Margulisiibacteriota bacterium]